MAVGWRPHDGFGADMTSRATGRFSTKNCWPSRSDSHWPITRARMSVPPAVPKGTMMRTGRVGYVCAFAIRKTAGESDGARCHMQKSPAVGKQPHAVASMKILVMKFHRPIYTDRRSSQKGTTQHFLSGVAMAGARVGNLRTPELKDGTAAPEADFLSANFWTKCPKKPAQAATTNSTAPLEARSRGSPGSPRVLRSQTKNEQHRLVAHLAKLGRHRVDGERRCGSGRIELRDIVCR